MTEAVLDTSALLRKTIEEIISEIQLRSDLDHNENRPKIRAPTYKDIIQSQQIKVGYKSPQRLPTLSSHLLYSRSGYRPHCWKTIFAILENRILKYYKQEKNTQPSGCLNFEMISCSCYIYKQRQIHFELLGSSKVFRLKFADENDLNRWAVAIYANLEDSVGASIPITEITTLPRYWRTMYINRSQFYNLAETGDLLLFKSGNFSSFALRVASRSSYDHVAIFFRDIEGELYLVEAIGSGGVQALRMDYFLSNQWQHLYKKLTLRKLYCERSAEFFSTFTDVINKWIGKPYKLTTEKLMRSRSFGEEYTDFFCSQLIAAVYKKLGFLPFDKSSCQFWPSSFAVRTKLELLNGARLGEEFVVKFDL
jgi:hypothetical protein